MKQPAAPTSLGIKSITWAYFLLVVGMAAFGYGSPSPLRLILLATAGALTLTAWICWRLTPLAYKLDGDTLTVLRRAGPLHFPGVIRVDRLAEGTRLGFKICGNDGLFAAIGWFWSRKLGIYRAFLTRTAVAELVAIQTNRRTILISPVEPDRFIATATNTGAARE